jgi:comEA protein
MRSKTMGSRAGMWVVRSWVVVAIVTGCLTLPLTSVAQEPAAQAPRVDARAGALVNLNTATSEQLEALPGVGPQTATRIVEYREKNGPFKKIEDLMNVKGIGEKSFLKLKPLVTVGAGRADRPTA